MKLTQKYIWDYDVKKLDLKKQDTLFWYLKRKIEHADWSVLDKKTLKQYLPKLDINIYLKQILKNFLKNNA
ncbi:hypothetical protein KJ992_02460 [Patescibacteria group bacterium]|nr:hypothetical protein [Patescibacteria group bacterium]